MAGNYRKEQIQNISATGEELDAWEALRREPGLMGRLARRGKRMKPSYVGGRRSFQPPGGGETSQGSGGAVGTGSSFGDSYGPGRSSNNSGAFSGGGETSEQRKAREAREAAAAAAAAEKAAKAKEKTEKLEKETEERNVRRGELTDEFGDYKGDYKDLRGRADYSEERGELKGYQGEADRLRGEAGTKFGGYESQIGKMPDRAEDVAGYGKDVAGLRKGIGEDVTAGQEVMGAAGQTMGEMAAKATDTGALMKDRGLFAGQIESQRKAKEKGTLGNLRRSMAASGASPQEIARAEAEASKGGGQSAREDAIAASMASMQSGRQGLSQAAGMTGQQAALAGQQAALGMQGGAMQGQLAQQAAGMAGQAQNLGLQKTQAQAGMYGQGLGAQQNLMATGAGLVGQRQGMLQGEIAQQAGLTGQMAGMTGAQLQDVVAQQNMAQEKDLAERGLTAQQQAAAANRPKDPSQMDQMMSMAQTVAPIAMMAMSDKKVKKNIKSAKDKDLMGAKQIDGFLNDLYAYEYNYKDSNHGAGKQVGVMAQDLEKTQLGKQMVENTPQGKQINAAKGLGLAMASQARLNQRLNSIGA